MKFRVDFQLYTYIYVPYLLYSYCVPVADLFIV